MGSILGSMVLSWWAAAPVVAQKRGLAQFWEEKSTTVLATMGAGIVGVLLAEPLKARLKRLGERLGPGLRGS